MMRVLVKGAHQPASCPLHHVWSRYSTAATQRESQEQLSTFYSKIKSKKYPDFRVVSVRTGRSKHYTLLFSLQFNVKGRPKKVCLYAPALELSGTTLGTPPAPSTLPGVLLLAHPMPKSCLPSTTNTTWHNIQRTSGSLLCI